MFLLDPEVAFLNHGSFGATPRPVMEAYQTWQRRLEEQPVQFLGYEILGYLKEARQALGDYIGAAAEDVAFMQNATIGVNIVARSLDLQPRDEILASNHEYGACENTWRFICGKTGALYEKITIPLPLATEDEIVELLWAGVTPYTKVIFLSHITSPSAIRLPIEEICKRARAAGILTLIDGAHAPGQIPLDMEGIGADFYSGNCHKWMMSPKGAGFLYARKEVQHLIEPLVVSWGWGNNPTVNSGTQFLNYMQWGGSFDPAAYLSVSAAIQFQRDYEWDKVREDCHELLVKTTEQIEAITELSGIYPNTDAYHQMAVWPLPHIEDLAAFKSQFYEKYKVEVPFVQLENHRFVRVCIQGYNTEEDTDRLVNALKKELRTAN